MVWPIIIPPAFCNRLITVDVYGDINESRMWEHALTVLSLRQKLAFTENAIPSIIDNDLFSLYLFSDNLACSIACYN